MIDEDFVLTERACACFMKQICEAMEYMHSNKVIHLDMKVNKLKFSLVLLQILLRTFPEYSQRMYCACPKAGTE